MRSCNQSIKLKISSSSNELAALYKIYTDCFEGAEFPVGSQWSWSAFAGELKTSKVLTAEMLGLAVGFVLIRDLPDNIWEITWLGVDPEYQRAGIMQALMEFIIAEKQHRKVWLEVHKNNVSACKLYKKMGFLEVGERPDYYGSGQTAVMMEYI